MHIKSLQVNGFGNLRNEKIELEKGLNVIIGKNEAGKSTLAHFVKAIFYGVNKNKDGNPYSEQERFTPWNTEEFSGKLVYEQDGKEYSVVRDFTRNNGKVFDEAGNDITAQFHKDRARGVAVGLSHFQMDEDTFQNSLWMKQAQVKVEESEQQVLMQKLTNMIQLGEEGTSYEKTKSRLEKILLEEVGTDKTQNKPKNMVNREILTYQKEKEDLERHRKRTEEIQKELKRYKEKQEMITKEYEEVKQVYDIKRKYEMQLEEKQTAFETAQKLMHKEQEERQKLKEKKLREGTLVIAVIVVMILAVLLVFRQYILGGLWLALGIAGGVLYRKLAKETETPTAELNFDLTKEELNKKEQKEFSMLQDSEMKNSLIERKSSDLKALCDGYEKSKNDIALEEHKLYLEMNAIQYHANQYQEAEENLQTAYEKKREIDSLERSIKLGMKVLEEAYEELKQELVPELGKLIQEKVAKTTNGEYENVIYNDAKGLFVENTKGEWIPIDKLSLGTIDQIYFGFRLAIASKLENIPIFLDETFAYYDEERLENVLKMLSKMAEEKQIVLLSCSEREKNILEKNGLQFHLITM